MEIFKYAIKLESSNIVLIHNHPHGSLNPSDSDIDTTNQILNIANKITAVNKKSITAWINAPQ